MNEEVEASKGLMTERPRHNEKNGSKISKTLKVFLDQLFKGCTNQVLEKLCSGSGNKFSTLEIDYKQQWKERLASAHKNYPNDVLTVATWVDLAEKMGTRINNRSTSIANILFVST